MKRTPFPGYEDHVNSYLSGSSPELMEIKKRNGEAMMTYTVPEGMTIVTHQIPSSVEGELMGLRVFTPAGLPKNSPMILDIHGGGFVGGNLDIDNGRCIAIATHTGCIVASVEYHLASEKYHFPTPVLDAFAAYRWLQQNAQELGGDPERMGLHGSSAGGTICAGLALYLRDHGCTQPKLTVLNCACYTNDLKGAMSYQQNYELKMDSDASPLGVESIYLGGYDGTRPSYYAFPAYCDDVSGLGAHFIIVAEYDTLRDGGLDYFRRLQAAGVPSEMLAAPRMAHCFTCHPGAYTDQVHDLMATSYRREFGML